MKDPLNDITYVKDFAKKNPHEWWAIKAIAVSGVLCIAAMLFIKGCDDTPVIKPKTTAEIKKEVTEFVKPVQAKIDSFKQVVNDSSKRLRSLEQLLYAAQAENKRLKSASIAVNKSETTDGTASQLATEYTEQITTAAANSDSIANLTINNLHSQLDNKDSIITQSELQTQIFRKGFNDMAANSQEKDRAIRDLNRKLRVKKVTGFVKTAAIVAAVVYVIVKK